MTKKLSIVVLALLFSSNFARRGVYGSHSHHNGHTHRSDRHRHYGSDWIDIAIPAVVGAVAATAAAVSESEAEKAYEDIYYDEPYANDEYYGIED